MSDEAKEIKKLKQAEKESPMAPRRLFKPVRALIFAAPTFCLLWGAFLVLTRPLPVEPTYTPAQVAIASPTFLAMATAVPLAATPTLAPTATDTTTPTNTATGTASATPTATATGTPTKTPRPAYAIIKMVTATPPPPLPPLDLEPFRFPMSVVALVALICGLTVCALIYVSRTYAEPIAAAASTSRPSPSSEVLSPLTWQPVININVGNSQPVAPAPIYSQVDGIHLLPSDDFGEDVDPPAPTEEEAEIEQIIPVSRVTPETRAALLFERAAQNGGVPLFSGDKMPVGEEWEDIHALFVNLAGFEFGRGKGGAKKATYEILWGRSAAGEGSYKIYSDKMNELDKE